MIGSLLIILAAAVCRTGSITLGLFADMNCDLDADAKPGGWARCSAGDRSRRKEGSWSIFTSLPIDTYHRHSVQALQETPWPVRQRC